jgi:hypothetical protein
MDNTVRIWILDTSALIDFKKIIGVSDQWHAFKTLEALVSDGSVAMPRQVIKEVSGIAHPDLPGAWAPGVRRSLRYPTDVPYEYLQRVMMVAGEVVDATKTDEDADPYVLAMALWLVDQGAEPVVVTTDQVDRLPIRIALATACQRLNIRCVDAGGFLTAVGIAIRRGN